MATQSAIRCPQCATELGPGARFCGVCGKTLGAPAAPLTLDALVGRTIGGRYRVISKLGAGGMGTVFRAEQISVKRAIALKVLDPAMTMNPELLRRFQAEAEVVARLSHPNTVTLFDFGQDETGVLFIAMELVQGTSLRDVLAREGAMSPFRAVDVAEQVASSLADAHAHGIVHRDLKPDNVILSERAGRRDFARVLDFGIAKLFDDPAGGAAMTRAGQILGTPQYMAPEQITGQAIDGRTDVYALGVMLYEMLAGKPPFQGDNLVALLSKHLHDTPPMLGSVKPGLTLPMPLDRVVFSCLAKEPRSRPADMKTLAAELGDLRALLDPGPRRPSALGPAVSPLPPPMPPPLSAHPSTNPASSPAVTPPPLPHPATLAPLTYSPLANVLSYGPGANLHQQPPPLPPLAQPPVQTPVQMTSMAQVREPAARKSRWPIAVLGLVIVGGSVAAGVLGTRGLKKDEDVPAVVDEPSTPAGPGETVRSERLGFVLQLPPGLTNREDPNTGGTIAQGTFGGMVMSIAVVAVDGADDPESRLQQLERATKGQATIVEQRTRLIRAAPHVSIVYESGGSRYETVFYPGNPSLAVTFAAPSSGFDDMAALRDAIFKDRFQPGAN